MPRGRRRVPADVNSLEEELKTLRQRQSELRQQIRKLRNSTSEIRKLTEKLEKQFASAKWTVGEIKQVQPEWDDLAFYAGVAAKKPTPRGRRPRSAAPVE